MIKKLFIKNYALIDELSVEFNEGFTILTGETGAGKSIIIDALGLALGGRAYTGMIREGYDFALVEAAFSDGDGKGETIIRREIMRDGRSRILINSDKSTLKVLRDLTANLVDIHGQHEHQRLLNPSSHLEFLDKFAGLDDIVSLYADKLKEYKQTKKRLETIIEDEKERERRKDLLRFQIDEIEKAGLTEGEDAQLEEERSFLRNGEKIAKLSDEAKTILLEEDLTGRISKLTSILEQLSQLDNSLGETTSQSRETFYIVNDIESAIERYISNLDFNPSRLEEVEARLSQISLMKKKYGETIEDILSYLSSSKEELSNLETEGESKETLEEQLNQLREEVLKIAIDISSGRREASPVLEKAVKQELSELGMDGTVFVVSIEYNEGDDAFVSDTSVGFTSNGLDRATFLISTNPGESAKPLVMVASGGELARVMLALRSMLADVDETPTLIFDEVDVGLGGRSAVQVATRLRRLGRTRQVITISHLPQIATFAHHHLKVDKVKKGKRAITVVRSVEGDERVNEIARMLSGESEVSKEALENAKRMIENVAIVDVKDGVEVLLSESGGTQKEMESEGD
jgi:DNA repair protein RecN (Recombination protein N)